MDGDDTIRPMLDSPHDALRDWMGRNGRDTGWVAQALQITQPHVRHLINGSRTPSLRLASRIAAVTGIPIAAWIREKATA